MKYVLIALALVANITLAPASAQSVADQEACQRHADKALAETKSNFPYESGWTRWVESHFNRKLHICMALIVISNHRPGEIETIRILQDAIGGQEFGSYNWANREGKKYWEVAPYACDYIKEDGSRVICNSTDEWIAATHHYMVE